MDNNQYTEITNLLHWIGSCVKDTSLTNREILIDIRRLLENMHDMMSDMRKPRYILEKTKHD